MIPGKVLHAYVKNAFKRHIIKFQYPKHIRQPIAIHEVRCPRRLRHIPRLPVPKMLATVMVSFARTEFDENSSVNTNAVKLLTPHRTVLSYACNLTSRQTTCPISNVLENCVESTILQARSLYPPHDGFVDTTKIVKIQPPPYVQINRYWLYPFALHKLLNTVVDKSM